MRIEGTETISAGRARVYELLTDPMTIATLLPGCEKLEPVGGNSYEVKLKLGLAALSGAYQGRVTLSELRPPEHLRLTLNSRGPWGFADGDGRLVLEEQGKGTLLRYAGELKVGGMIAAVGQRLLDATARKLIGDFFRNLTARARGA
jgi:carbon monoxide dehydrogenase subunit G